MDFSSASPLRKIALQCILLSDVTVSSYAKESRYGAKKTAED